MRPATVAVALSSVIVTVTCRSGAAKVKAPWPSTRSPCLVVEWTTNEPW
ncbi:hypothetical protein [Nonomuraea dietziae]